MPVGKLPIFALLLALAAAGPYARASESNTCTGPDCVVKKGGVVDGSGEGQTAGTQPAPGTNQGPAFGNPVPTTTSVEPPKPPPTSGEAASSFADSVTKTTGTKEDSQGHVQGTHSQMSRLGGSSSRTVGSMDLVEAILIMPFNPSRAAKLLLSGKQAHEAAQGLDAVAAKAQYNNNLMQGTPNLAGTNGAQSTGGNAAPAAQQPGSTGASSPAAEARAGELYGQLEDKYGVGRDEFEAEANRVQGDPEAIGAFMQELTGEKAVGKDAVNAALDAYAAELGIARGDLYKHSAAQEFAVSEAPAARPAPSAPVPTAPAPMSEAERKLAAAKEKEKKESIRDKLKRALAERRAGRPGEGQLAAETLQPLEDQFFESIKAEHDHELSLFDVVRAKYAEKRSMLERAPGAQ